MTRVHRTVATAALVLAAPLLLAACSDDGDDNEASSDSSTTSTSSAVNTGPTVEVVEFAFTPSTETVAVGETVTWSNTGSSLHTVTPDGEDDESAPFESTQIEPGESFVQTFSTPGTYAYVCSIHPDRMSGSVVVNPA